MASPRFTAIPAIPQTGIDEWQLRLLSALKENVELLTGTRGEEDRSSVALVRSRLNVSPPPAQTMTRVSAQGAGVTVSGVSIPTLEDYGRLLSDTQRLANDVAVLRATVATLVNQLRA